ncbi:MAG: hypothetical protein ACK5LF_16335 [Bacteroides xylanisolvens]
MVDIKDIQGNILLSTPINEGSKRKFTLQKEDYIALKFSVDNPIYFKLGDGIDDDNIGLFELVDLYKPTYNESTGGYDYELQLDAYYWKWKNKIFKFSPESGGQESVWNLTAGLDVHLGIFLRNLKSLSYTYRGIAFEFSIDSTVENSSKLVSYDSTNMIDALTKMAETWECEWWITDNIIHFGRCEFGDPVDFEIDVNVKSMPRSDSQTNYATRIYAFGSTRNIPTNYRPVDENIVVNGVVQKRLMLPVGTPYIDAYEDMSEEEAVEDIVIFDDIYPRRVGTMSDITPHPIPVKDDSGKDTGQTVNVYRFKDLGMMFSKEYILEGEELKIIFQSGSLNGMEFGVIFNPEGKDEKLSNGLWNPEAQLWEIVRSEDYGRNLPDDILKPVAGDTYVLSGFDTSLVSDQYLPAAEQELKEKAQAYVEKTKKDPSTYSCTMSSVYMHNDGESRIFEIGDRVNLINKGYFENGRMSRIIGFEYYLDKPCDSTIYTVGETAAYSRIGEIEDKIDDVTYKGQTYTGGSGSGVYVIRTNDNTIASNSNVFSARRSKTEFTSKKYDDIVAGFIEFLNGIDVTNGLSTDTLNATEITTQLLSVLDKLVAKTATFSGDISSKDYVMNLLGWLITPTGDINANSLRLRDFLEVPEFRYNRISVVSGERWNAPGGGLIESVDEENGILYLKLEPGEVANIMLDDICKASFNNSTGFQTAYFRIAEQLGESTFKYVLRSGTSAHPCKAMHFVAYGNFTNEDRQKSCYSAQNYIRFLKGVNSWEITKEMIAMQLGDLSNLKLFGMDMTGHSAYLRNIYMTGVIKQISDDGVTESRVPCFKGEWAEGAYYYYDEVTHNGSTWLCISEKPTIQEPMEDAADWLEKSAAGKDAVVINIMSSNGNVFQNGSVSTTLTAYVIKGDRDITDSVPPSRFSWEKESNNSDTDKIFNETHVGHGHVLTLTSDDVWGRATFNCIVSL